MMTVDMMMIIMLDMNLMDMKMTLKISLRLMLR